MEETENEGLEDERSISNTLEAKKEVDKETDEARELEHLKKLEAALFIAGKWMNMQELVMLTDLNPILLRQLLDKIQEKFSKETSAIEILNKEDCWKMDVREEYVNIASKLATGNSEFTKAEQETLAVIAYKQPVKQSVIIKIRGNKAYDHIHSFRSLGLIKAKRLGHTWELNLSEDFYNYFHVRNSDNEISEHHENSKVNDKFSGVRNQDKE